MTDAARPTGLSLPGQRGPISFTIEGARLDPDEEFLGNLTLSLRCRADQATDLGRMLRVSIVGSEASSPIAHSLDLGGLSLVFHSAALEERARRREPTKIEVSDARGRRLATFEVEIAHEAAAAEVSERVSAAASANTPSVAPVGLEPSPGGTAITTGALLTDVALSIAATAWAMLQGWSASDAVWGLWIYALCIGGALITVPFVLGSFLTHPGDEAGRRLPNTAARLLVGASLLAVFLVFSHGHLRFLASMIPLSWSGDLANEAASSPTLASTVGTLVHSYWGLLLIGAIEQILTLVRERSSADVGLLLRPWLLIAKVHLLILLTTFLEPLQGSKSWTALLIFFCLAPIESGLLRLHRRSEPPPS